MTPPGLRHDDNGQQQSCNAARNNKQAQLLAQSHALAPLRHRFFALLYNASFRPRVNCSELQYETDGLGLPRRLGSSHRSNLLRTYCLRQSLIFPLANCGKGESDTNAFAVHRIRYELPLTATFVRKYAKVH